MAFAFKVCMVLWVILSLCFAFYFCCVFFFLSFFLFFSVYTRSIEHRCIVDTVRERRSKGGKTETLKQKRQREPMMVRAREQR